MRNLFRGGAILSIFSLCVVFLYAQVTTDATLDTAIDSQVTIQNNLTEILSDNNSIIQQQIGNPVASSTPTTPKAAVVSEEVKESDAPKEETKLVRKTASVTARSSGVSRGSFSATAYCLRGKTAMGHGVRRGIIAADPRVLKLGSKITINAGPYSGTYLVSDTGGSIKGKDLDIWMPSCSEAKRFGRRTVQVFTGQ